MIESALNLFRIPELRKKILITIGLLIVYRIGFHIPIPGIDIAALKEYLDRLMADQGGGLASILPILNALSCAQIGQMVLFSLGVMPYISASIIFSLLVKIVPSLERLSKEGAAGYKKINQYTRYLAVPICIVQSILVIQGFRALTQDRFILSSITSSWISLFGWQMLAILAFTAGTIFIMWLGEQITEHGVGNGISLIIMAGIIARTPAALFTFFSNDQAEQGERITDGLTLLMLFVAVVFVVVYITKGQRRIPIQQAKLTRGRKVYGGQRHYLPLKVNQAGVMPIIFASALMVIPAFLGKLPLLGWMGDAFSRGAGFWYNFVYIGLIFFFSFFWTALMFQPNELANNLKEHGSFIPGIRPGKRTADYLEQVMVRITLAGATFLAIIAILPQLVMDAIRLNIPSQLAYFLGGTSILITVSVALDLVDKLNSHLLMRNYDGFMKGQWGQRGMGRRQ